MSNQPNNRSPLFKPSSSIEQLDPKESSTIESNANQNLQEDSIVLILDLSPTGWRSGVIPRSEQPENKLYLQNLYCILVNFLKYFGYMSLRNKCCIIGANNASWYVQHKILYEGAVFNDWIPSCFSGDNSQTKYVESKMAKIWNDMVEFMALGFKHPDGDSQLTSAISMGFLYLNRIKMMNAGYGRKILIFDISNRENYKSQYIGLMNIAYSALNRNITINTFALGQPSRILEQLSTITNAKYLLISKVLQFDFNYANLNQYLSQLLTFWFLPSEGIGELLSTNFLLEFGNTGICYCHYRTIDICYLCPCCFAVYCSEVDDKGKYRIVCMVCGSRLTRKLLKQKVSTEADFSKV